MKPVHYPSLVASLREYHRSFFDKCSPFIVKNVGGRALERGALLIRMGFIAKALRESGVIDSYKEVDVLNHAQSIELQPKLGLEPFYLLNDCTDVIAICGGIACEDALSGRLVLVHGEASSSKSTFFKRYKNVLSDEFDWDIFAHEILEAIHKTLYNKSEVLKEFVNSELFND